MDHESVGARGEQAAALYLERLGMQVIDRNWRTARGELDIVALDGEELVVVEVKARTSGDTGTPEEAVSPRKQQRIARMAEAYIAANGLDGCPVRFDVIAIRVLGDHRALLRHHRGAFMAGDSCRP